MENGGNHSRMDEANSACDDLKFFERRLTEIVAQMQPSASKWRCFFLVLILTIFFSVVYAGYIWATDPTMTVFSLYESLEAQNLFTFAITVVVLFVTVFGVHKRVVAPRIVIDRVKAVLADFCLTCDEEGKLIIKPTARPHRNLS